MKPSVNQGIQGTNVNVTADALAVGSNARATSRRVSSTSEEALAAIKELREAVATLNLRREAHAQVAATVRELEATVTAPQPQAARVAGVMDKVIGALDQAGTAVAKATVLAAPLAKLAALFGIPIPG
jgi:hypothetical protein